MPINALAGDWHVILVLVFTLGVRHGLDADHIVAIDGLTRFNAAHNARLARWCGFLFSLGHGVAVIALALAVTVLGSAGNVPRWLEDTGAWISILMLLALGVVNLWLVFQGSFDAPVQLVGLKGRYFGRLQYSKNPTVVAVIGAAFAVSFDTVSQAAMFAMLGVQFGGWAYCLILGTLFAAGMMLVDACNGWWVFRMISHVNRTALIASRFFGAVVALLSLLVAGFGVSKYLSPQVGAWSEGRELEFGLVLVGVVAVGFIAAVALSRMIATKA